MPYQYLILRDNKSFYTHWFDANNNYAEGMIVFDLQNHIFTTNGIDWNDIEEDHL